MATKTITLPALPSDQVYRAIPVGIDFHIDGASKVKSDYRFEMDGDSALSPALLGAAIRQGLIRYVGTATTSAKEGESAKEACDRRFAEMVAGTYKPGSGGGARVDTFTLVLRESIITAMLNNIGGLKKVDATKAVKDDAKAAFMLACNKVAEKVDATGDEVFAINWPQVEESSQAEANRRDSAADIGFDLGDFAPDAGDTA